METYERIRELRKKYLHLSQTDFGKKLGVSRSVINNIELNTLARPDQKLSLYKLICSEFNINEEWLLYGTEPMFVQSDAFNLDAFIKSKNATDFELEIVKTYFDLEPEIRKAAMEHFKRRLVSAVAQNPALLVPDTEEELEAQYPPINADKASSRVGTRL